MKKLILIAILFCFSNFSNAQLWFDIGLKGGPGTSFLINSEMFDDAQFNHKFTFSYFAGGKIGINFGEKNGITVNLTTTGLAQNFANSHPGLGYSTRRVSSQTFDIGLYYRFTKESTYFEIGPQFSMLMSPKGLQDDVENNLLVANMSKNYIGAVLGIGGYIIGTDRLTLTGGLQFSYGFTDIFPNDIQPAPDLPDLYTTGAKTMPLAIMLNLELNYSLGFLVRASCGKRTALIGF